jgi:hypothetical protein
MKQWELGKYQENQQNLKINNSKSNEHETQNG